MISVIIPLYNKASSVRNTIDSVLNQSYKDFELIVVDDGSTDESYDIVKEISDTRLRLLRQPNSGVSAARNLGIAEAIGEYIALLDADDIWMSDYLDTQILLTQRYPECDIFAVNYTFRDEHGHLTPTKINHLPFESVDGVLTNYFDVASCSNPPLWTSAVMIKKNSIDAVGGFPNGIITGEDLLTWARLACRYRIAYHTLAKVFYEMPSGGTLRIDPKDMSLKNDTVRNELISLFQEFKPIGWKAYISFWDKMRAVINIKKGERVECIKYAMRSLRYNPLSIKTMILLILTIVPQNIIYRILK